ncbi:hypothetical protein ACFOM8_17655 [Paracoccus angustae]|uniref:Uncharacterized protein n=1 Tax=Paracoccus angustae TaxID=1671480 RepID=A0ABV7U8F6_9RHOB
MMLKIGVGYAPRAPRALQAQPVQGLLVAVASDNASVPVNPVALTVEVAAPSPHAGSYLLALADLARGPVCLAAPAIRDGDDGLAAEPGLWACDAARGPVVVTRQWLANGTVIADAAGLSFAPAASHAGQDIVHAETAAQGEIRATSLSKALALPIVATPEPARLSVAGDATLGLVVDPAGTAGIEIIEPQIYAGSYTIQAAELKKGPLWLVPARIGGTAQVGASLGVVSRGLPVGDGDAAPMSRQGQWQRDGAPIPDATGETYQIQAADAGRRIGFLETATDSHGARRQMSNEIAIGGTS